MHGGSWARLPACERRWKERVDDYFAGGFAEEPVVVPGEVPDLLECFVDADPVPFGDDAFGLFDHDPGVQCDFELRRERPRVVDRALLEDADGRDVGHGLRDGEIALGECGAAGREEIERADHLGAQSHRHRRDRFEAALAGVGRESWPPRAVRPRSESQATVAWVV